MNTENTRNQDLNELLAAAEPPKQKRIFKRLLYSALLLLGGMLVFFTWGMDHNGKAVEYRTEQAERGDITVIVTATGNLEPTNQVDVGTEVSGTVKTVDVDYNDVVEAGQVLARLDTTKLEAQLSRSRAAVEYARANLLQARAGLKEAENDLQRLKQVRELSGGKLPSVNEMETAEAAVERARANEAMAGANIAEAEASLKVDQTNLEKAVILSPINGVVLKRSVEPGQTVAASLQAPVLFTLAEDLAEMELHVNVDEADVGQVREGQEAVFTVDAYPDRTFPASISQVRYGSDASEGVVTYPTVLTVENEDLSLRPGMTATADIIVKEVKDALLVPNAALRYVPQQPEMKEPQAGGSLLSKLFPRPSRGRPQKKNTGNGKNQQVWTLKSGQPAAVPVTVGATSGFMTEILSGEVTEGMELIIESIGSQK